MGVPREQIVAQLAKIPGRVRCGHNWFTLIDPQYAIRIDPGRIQMWANRWCPLGQYAVAVGFTGVNAPYLFLEQAGVAPRDYGFMPDHGFACPIGWEDERTVPFSALDAYYSLLRDEWVRMLTHEPTVALDTISGHR